MVIYKITNLINGKIYVGKSVRNPKNYFGSGKLIKQAINKYGISSFTKEILEVCETLDQLSNREKFWIKELGSQHRGYNIAEGGTGGDTTSNHPNRDEIIEKRRIKNIGKKRTPEFCKLMSKLHKKRLLSIDKETKLIWGRKAADTKKNRMKASGYTDKEKEAKLKNTEKLIQFNKSEKGRKLTSDRFKGKSNGPFSEEHRLNIGKASKGRPGSNHRIISIDNIEYKSLHDASRLLTIPVTTIRARLLNPKFIGWFYVCN